MPKEIANCRDVLSYINIDMGVPLMMTRGDAAKVLGISRAKVDEYIARGLLKLVGNKIPAMQVARLISL